MNYLTLEQPSEGKYTEKMSRFLAFAFPVTTEAEAKAVISRMQNDYHDARHVCWAYMIGSARATYQSSDNGEPSGTAGKPILGQINSFGLTDVAIIVVRYFGGIKLGTSGLIGAYRQAARLAIEAGNIIECHDREQFSFTFDYENMHHVMKVLKSANISIISQSFDNICSITLECNADDAPLLRSLLKDSIHSAN